MISHLLMTIFGSLAVATVFFLVTLIGTGHFQIYLEKKCFPTSIAEDTAISALVTCFGVILLCIQFIIFGFILQYFGY